MKDIVVDIVDDHKMVIGGLRDMLKGFSGLQLGHTYANGKDLLEGLAVRQPDVLLLDIQLPDIHGDELAGVIRLAYPAIRIIALTGFNTAEHARLMLEKGVAGYVLKNTDENKLLRAIETVAGGGRYIDAPIQEKILNELYGDEKEQGLGYKPMLTRREKEILSLIMEELTSQQMADRLALSLRTVENHRVSLMQKLNAKNSAGIVKRAFQLGLVRK